MAEWIGALNSRSGALVQQSVGSIPGRNTCARAMTRNYRCFSPPRGKWVLVSVEMVLVIDFAEKCIILHRLYTPQEAEMV